MSLVLSRGLPVERGGRASHHGYCSHLCLSRIIASIGAVMGPTH